MMTWRSKEWIGKIWKERHYMKIKEKIEMLMVLPLKMPASSLPFLVMRKILGIGHGGSYDSRRSTALGERMSIPCAPSPPRHFCHEKVMTSSLSHGMCCAKTAEVESAMVRPWRSAGILTSAGTRTPEVVPLAVKMTSWLKSILAVRRDLDVSGDAHARGGAVGGEDDVLVEVDLGEVGQHAVVALHVGHVLELELLHDVRVPVA